MLTLHQVVVPADPCPYLPQETARTEYTLVGALDPSEYEALMDRGYRKFGAILFRPVCRSCRECRPLRIPIARFRPDRSQRRAQRRNEDLEVRVAAPTVDEQRLDLYHRYHAARSEVRGWPEQQRHKDEYEATFLANVLPAVEVTLWEGRTLLAVLLTELTPRTVSGIYHYYEPDLPQRSLGTTCMLQTIELGRRLGKQWAYFGYLVRGCPSMAYKARFRPHEILDVDGVWRPGA